MIRSASSVTGSLGGKLTACTRSGLGGAILFLSTTVAIAAPPPGMSPALFQTMRVQNMVDRSNGQGAECPAVRKIDCRPLAGKGKQFACAFDEKTRAGWARRHGVLGNFDGHWDFNSAALRSCVLH